MNASSSGNECPICLTSEIQCNVLCMNNCGHVYCKGCIDNWLDLGKNICPMCRQPIQYIKHNNETYRVVVKQQNASRTRDDVRPPNNRYIMIRKDIFGILRTGFCITMLLLIGQVSYMMNRYRDNSDTISNYNHCLHHYANEKGIMECTYNDQTDEYIPCNEILPCLTD
jgi:hypothetical protein